MPWETHDPTAKVFREVGAYEDFGASPFISFARKRPTLCDVGCHTYSNVSNALARVYSHVAIRSEPNP